MVTDLEKRVEEANVNSMSISIHQQLDDPNRFVVSGATGMERINTVTVLEDIADNLNFGILHIMLCRHLMGNVIDEEVYRAFERFNPV